MIDCRRKWISSLAQTQTTFVYVSLLDLHVVRELTTSQSELGLEVILQQRHLLDGRVQRLIHQLLCILALLRKALLLHKHIVSKD